MLNVSKKHCCFLKLFVADFCMGFPQAVLKTLKLYYIRYGHTYGSSLRGRHIRYPKLRFVGEPTISTHPPASIGSISQPDSPTNWIQVFALTTRFLVSMHLIEMLTGWYHENITTTGLYYPFFDYIFSETNTLSPQQAHQKDRCDPMPGKLCRKRR